MIACLEADHRVDTRRAPQYLQVGVLAASRPRLPRGMPFKRRPARRERRSTKPFAKEPEAAQALCGGRSRVHDAAREAAMKHLFKFGAAIHMHAKRGSIKCAMH